MKIDKKEQVLGKDLLKVVERIEKMEQKSEKQLASFAKRIDSIDGKHINKNIQIKEEFSSVNGKLSEIQKQLKLNINSINETIKTQEEIITDMMKKFNETQLKDKNQLLADIESLKNQIDVMKISFTLNEKKLQQKINKMIQDEIKKSVKTKETEVLMNIWISELKDIVKDFDALKKMHPKEFEIKISEICNIIDLFKIKLAK